MGKKCGMKNSLSLRLCECGAYVCVVCWRVGACMCLKQFALSLSLSGTLSCRVFFPLKAHEQHTSLLHVHLYTEHIYDEWGHMDEHKLYVKLASWAMYKRKCCKRKWKKNTSDNKCERRIGKDSKWSLLQMCTAEIEKEQKKTTPK